MLYLLDCLILSDFFVVTSNSRQFTLLIAVQALSKITQYALQKLAHLHRKLAISC